MCAVLSVDKLCGEEPPGEPGRASLFLASFSFPLSRWQPSPRLSDTPWLPLRVRDTHRTKAQAGMNLMKTVQARVQGGDKSRW